MERTGFRPSSVPIAGLGPAAASTSCLVPTPETGTGLAGAAERRTPEPDWPWCGVAWRGEDDRAGGFNH